MPRHAVQISVPNCRSLEYQPGAAQRVIRRGTTGGGAGEGAPWGQGSRRTRWGQARGGPAPCGGRCRLIAGSPCSKLPESPRGFGSCFSHPLPPRHLRALLFLLIVVGFIPHRFIWRGQPLVTPSPHCLLQGQPFLIISRRCLIQGQPFLSTSPCSLPRPAVSQQLPNDLPDARRWV